MTLMLAIVLLGPIALIGTVLTENVATLGERLRAAMESGMPAPHFLDDVPIVGKPLAEKWNQLVADGTLTAEARQLLGSAVQRLLGAAAVVGSGIAELALSIFCTFFFFRDGEAAVHRVSDIAKQVAGGRGERLLSVGHLTLKGVVYGVLGSVFAQALLSTFGYWLAGVPAPFFLGLATGFFGIIPAGVGLVWIPATLWLFHVDQTGWGIFVLVWSVVLVGNIDSVIKPLFVSRGTDLPLLIILIGILGGAIAIGFIGLFLGPTILAVLYALMREWSPGVYGGGAASTASAELPQTGGASE